MDKALYLGMSGAKQNMLSQRAHANNLANVNTTGFKKDFAQARSMPVFGGTSSYPCLCHGRAPTYRSIRWRADANWPKDGRCTGR